MCCLTCKGGRALFVSRAYGQIPVSRALCSGFLTPIQILRILRGQDRHCSLLESDADNESWGRWSFLGLEPDMEIPCQGAGIRTVSERVEETGCPSGALRRLLTRHKSHRMDGLSPLRGGPVSHVAYGHVKYGAPIPRLNGHNQGQFYDMDLMLFCEENQDLRPLPSIGGQLHQLDWVRLVRLRHPLPRQPPELEPRADVVAGPEVGSDHHPGRRVCGPAGRRSVRIQYLPGGSDLAGQRRRPALRLVPGGRVTPPFLLAGGLMPGNIPQAMAWLDPLVIDLPAGWSPQRRKDRTKILAAVAAVRKE